MPKIQIKNTEVKENKVYRIRYEVLKECFIKADSPADAEDMFWDSNGVENDREIEMVGGSVVVDLYKIGDKFVY